MSMANEWQHLKIPFHEIAVATENFKTFIGRGGYGSVYKGKLLVSGEETMVAVKRLNEQFGQGLKEFLTEIQLLSGQEHPNLISLVGFCDEGREMSIIYEYAERGSLDQYIRRTRKTTSTTLTWLQRLKICVDAARGLYHLHSHVGGHRTIIHRDIKSSNILIDENWVAKISDLGLSKLSVTGFGMSVIVTNGCGTNGYCDPEYYTTGILTKKSDVYSFGVVLFEVLCGRLCLSDSDDGFSLSSKSAKYHYKKNSLEKIMDDSLREHMGSYSMTKFSEIAYRCLHDDREQRPAMDVVVKELEEALKYQVRRHDKMGMNVGPLKDITPEEEKVLTLELQKNMDPNDTQNEKSRGQIMTDLVYEPFKDDQSPVDGEENAIEKAPYGTPEGGGLLLVIIHEAENLEGKHHMNPSVRLLFKGEEKKTKTVKKNRDPRWGEDFAFFLEEPPTNDRMHFEVVSTSSRMGLIHPKESLGYVDIQLADVVKNKRINEKYHLIDSRNGKLQVELQWRTSS